MRLHYRKTGPASTAARCVFIHGAGASLQLFGNQYQAFRDLTTCYFLDLPGHGQSVHPIEEVTIELYAEAVIDFVNYLPSPAVLVGHSMGGAVALSVALSDPGLVHSLVLIGTGCSLPVSKRILDGLESDYDATLDTIVRLCFSKSADPKLVSNARSEMGKTDREIVRADFRACNAFSCPSQARAHQPGLSFTHTIHFDETGQSASRLLQWVAPDGESARRGNSEHHGAITD